MQELESLRDELLHIQDMSMELTLKKYPKASFSSESHQTMAGIALDEYRHCITRYINERIFNLTKDDNSLITLT